MGEKTRYFVDIDRLGVQENIQKLEYLERLRSEGLLSLESPGVYIRPDKDQRKE